MTLPYQLARHVAAHMRQWPHANRAEVTRRIRAALTTGNAWLWPDPQQLELFGAAK